MEYAQTDVKLWDKWWPVRYSYEEWDRGDGAYYLHAVQIDGEWLGKDEADAVVDVTKLQARIGREVLRDAEECAS